MNGSKISSLGTVSYLKKKIQEKETHDNNNSNNKYFPQLIVNYNGTQFPIHNTVIKISQRLNEHTKLLLQGTINSGYYDTFVLESNTKTNIELIYEINEKSIFLFTGIISNIQNRTQGINENAVYYITIEALSYSSLLDIKYINKSFQDINMSYDELLSKVVKSYDGGDFKNCVAKGEVLSGFTLQYIEKDWEFIIRMASRFNAPIVVNHTFKSPKITFGVDFNNEVQKIDCYDYKLIRNTERYRAISQNHSSLFKEMDALEYEITTKGADDVSLVIGDAVVFNGNTLYVKSVDIHVKDHILYHVYRFSNKNSFFQIPLYNEKIVGLSLIGKVISVTKNLLKVHLDIDKSQDVGKAYWFNYSTFYSTWYCMPELGDYVNTYFPTKNEFNGIIINSIKQKPQNDFPRERTKSGGSENPNSPSKKSDNPPLDFETLADDEKVKMLVTEQGKMIILDDRNGVVTILCNNGTYITLSDSNGISIITNNDISVNAAGNINLDSKNVIYMQAKEEIKFECGETSILIDKEQIKAVSKDIHLNQ